MISTWTTWTSRPRLGAFATRGLPVRASGVLGLLSCLFFVGGCWTYTPGTSPATLRPEPLPPNSWPQRDIEAVKPLLESTPDQVFRYRYAEGADRTKLNENVRKAVEEPTYVVEYKGLHGHGLVRIYHQTSTDVFGAIIQEMVYGFQSNASFVTSRTLNDPAAVEARAEGREQREHTAENPDRATTIVTYSEKDYQPVFNKVPEGVLVETHSEQDLFLTSGGQIRVPPVQVSPPRGVLLHFPAIYGNEYERSVIAEFEKRGWAIVDLKPAASIRSPIPPANQEKLTALKKERDQLWEEMSHADGKAVPVKSSDPRFERWIATGTEISTLKSGSFQACPGTDLDAVAAQIAATIDEDLAGSAYGAEAVVDYLRTQRPDLPKHPLVAVGFSAGAIAAPTAASLVRDSLDALVLIGGGADVFLLSQHSSFTDGGLRVRCGEKKVDEPTLVKLDELYMRHTKLDPYYTAPTLRGLPTLVVDAKNDTWVPIAGGDMLFERLGRPERWQISTDHDLLFYFLPGKAKRIAEWVEKTVGLSEYHAPPSYARE